MTNLEKLAEAQHEFEEDHTWSLAGYNEWLLERYGVRFVPIQKVFDPEFIDFDVLDEKFIEIVHPDRYIFFILKWP